MNNNPKWKRIRLHWTSIQRFVVKNLFSLPVCFIISLKMIFLWSRCVSLLVIDTDHTEVAHQCLLTHNKPARWNEAVLHIHTSHTPTTFCCLFNHFISAVDQLWPLILPPFSHTGLQQGSIRGEVMCKKQKPWKMDFYLVDSCKCWIHHLPHTAIPCTMVTLSHLKFGCKQT